MYGKHTHYHPRGAQWTRIFTVNGEGEFVGLKKGIFIGQLIRAGLGGWGEGGGGGRFTLKLQSVDKGS